MLSVNADQRDWSSDLDLSSFTTGLDDLGKEKIAKLVTKIPKNDQASVISLASRFITKEMNPQQREKILRVIRSIRKENQQSVADLASHLITDSMSSADRVIIIHNVHSISKENQMSIVHLARHLITSWMGGKDVSRLIQILRYISKEDQMLILDLGLCGLMSDLDKEEIIKILTHISKEEDSFISHLVITESMSNAGRAVIIKALDLIPKENRAFVTYLASRLINEGMDAFAREEIINAVKDLRREDMPSVVFLACRLVIEEMDAFARKEMIDVVSDIRRNAQIGVVDLVIPGSMSDADRSTIIKALLHVSKKDRGFVIYLASRLITKNLNAWARGEIITALNHVSTKELSSVVYLANYLITDEMDGFARAKMIGVVNDISMGNRLSIIDLTCRVITQEMDAWEREEMINVVKDIPREDRRTVVDLACCVITKEMDAEKRGKILRSLSVAEHLDCIWDLIQCGVFDGLDFIDTMEMIKNPRFFVFSVNSEEIKKNPLRTLLRLSNELGIAQVLFPSQFSYPNSLGVDTGGLTRSSVTKWITGLCNSRDPKCIMEANSNGYIPKIDSSRKDVTLEEQELCYKMIGRFFVLALKKYRSIVVGNYFHPALFEMIFSLSEIDLEKNDISESSDKLLRVYLKKMFQKILEESDIEDILKNNITEKLISLGIESKEFIFKEYEIDKKIEASLIIAKEMNRLLNAKHSWDSLKGNSVGEFTQRIQGILSKSKVREALRFNKKPDKKYKFYFKKWVDKASFTQLENFVEAISGLRSLPAQQELNVNLYRAESPDALPQFHTCNVTIDIPIQHFDQYQLFKQKLDMSIEYALTESGYQEA